MNMSAEQRKIYMFKYRNSEKGKEARRKYKNSVKGRKAKFKYNHSERGRKATLKYYHSEKGIKKRLEYENSEKCRETRLKYYCSEGGREVRLKYENSERGYFIKMWHDIKKSKHGNEFKNYEEFFQCWIDQQKIYGTKCPYTGVEMTRIALGNKRGSQVRINTNISKDRIKSNFPYSKKNLMFVTWKINLEKGAITTKTAESFLKFERERFGTHEVE